MAAQVKATGLALPSENVGERGKREKRRGEMERERKATGSAVVRGGGGGIGFPRVAPDDL